MKKVILIVVLFLLAGMGLSLLAGNNKFGSKPADETTGAPGTGTEETTGGTDTSPYMLSGAYNLENLRNRLPSNNISQEIVFTFSFWGMETKTGSRIDIYPSEGRVSYFYDGAVQTVCSPTWQWDTNFGSIDFGSTPQPVSREFYLIFKDDPLIEDTEDTDNNTPEEQVLEAGYYTFANTLTFTGASASELCKQEFDFTCLLSDSSGGYNFRTCEKLQYGIDSYGSSVVHVNDEPVYNASAFGGWDYGECILFVSEAQVVSGDFKSWITSNTTYSVTKENYLGGTHTWDQTSINGENIEQLFNFTAVIDGETVSCDKFVVDQYGDIYIYAGSQSYCLMGGGAKSFGDVVMNFGATPQLVSAEFYTWFIANSTPGATQAQSLQAAAFVSDSALAAASEATEDTIVCDDGVILHPDGSLELPKVGF